MKSINANKKTVITVVAVFLVGAVLAALILFSKKSGPETAEAPTASAHAEAGKHGDGEHHGEPAKAEHKDEKGHADGEHHAEKKGGEGHDEEEKVSITDAQVKGASIAIANSGPAAIGSLTQLTGEVKFNEDRTAHVVPRLAGVVDKVSADLGQQVKKGQILALIASTQLSEMRSELKTAQQRRALAELTYEREKKLWQDKISAQQDYLLAEQAFRDAQIAEQNAKQKLIAIGAGTDVSGSLNQFALRAPFDGMIVEKHLSLGESVREDAMVFTISDLSTVWAEIIVSPKDLDMVRVGEKVSVTAVATQSNAQGTVSYVGSLIGEQNRSAKARVVLANPGMAWRPGLFVNVAVAGDTATVPVAVLAEGLQTIEDKPAVFVRVAGGFKTQPVTVGRSDGISVEITKGLAAGTPYATRNSFVVKAEQGKGSADHAH